ncbi:MAG: hypothetical protein M3R62_14200, partial [Acidobacteriota bacterium]|nr:hypothetical protein [Acidobacteriota bacterium]
MVFLGYQSYSEDRRDPSVRAKLAAQEEAEKAYAKAPFEPDEGSLAIGSPSGPAPASLSGPEAKGALLFESEGCSACHGAG